MCVSAPPSSGASWHFVSGQPVLKVALPANGSPGQRKSATLLSRPGMFGSSVQLDPSVHKHHPHPAGVHLPLCTVRLRPEDERENRFFHLLQLFLQQRAAQCRDSAATFKRWRAKHAAVRGQQGGQGPARRPRNDVCQRASVEELRADGLRGIPVAHVPADLLPPAEDDSREQRSHSQEPPAGAGREVQGLSISSSIEQPHISLFNRLTNDTFVASLLRQLLGKVHRFPAPVCQCSFEAD